MANKDSFYLQLEKIFIENQMYKQPWFENAPSIEELIDRTKKELEDHMEGVYSISDDYIQKLLSIKNSYIAHYDGSKLEFEVVKDHIRNILFEKKVGFKSISYEIGPVVTLYKIRLEDNVRMEKIHKIESYIRLELGVTGVRILAPVPRMDRVVSIEVPNKQPQPITMDSIWNSSRWQNESKMTLPVTLGRSTSGEVFMFDLAKAPHVLIGGTCGTGKSVTVNAIIASLLHKKKPSELKLVLVDPKKVEFAPYKPLGSSYLDAFPEIDKEDAIIYDCDTLIDALILLVTEMENRYALLMDAGARDIISYNEMIISHQLNTDRLVGQDLRHHYLPYIVTIIDEYGDFIMQAGKIVEFYIGRITQKARAVGMHMILTTQRPSVNIVTGMIKANFPTRIALRTQSIIDSRTILDSKGAEQLNGRGDMIFLDSYYDITRVQGAYMSEEEVDKMVSDIYKSSSKE